jgi:hypothetical protein
MTREATAGGQPASPEIDSANCPWLTIYAYGHSTEWQSGKRSDYLKVAPIFSVF